MKKEKQRIMSLFLFLACSFAAFAQSSFIQGEVLDSATNEPMIGVSVTITGTSTGTITDFDGKFSLQIRQQETLEFSYTGYSKQSVTVKPGDAYFTVKLAEDMQELEEVIVVGYGIQKKVSSVASITSAKGEDMLKAGNLNSVSEILQGKLNGVVTINKSGKPGGNATDMYIRGVSSWTSSKPLTLVDGVERDIDDIDINEIEDISVLKDASATAVYGVRGANGVILVTTKRGTNKKPRVNFSSNFGFKQFTTKLEWADYLRSMQMYNEAAANDQAWTKQFSQSTMNAWENAYATGNYGPYNDYFPQVDWWNEMVKNFGLSQNYNLNINGGNDFLNYFVSVGYQNDGDNYNIEKQNEFDPRYYYRRYNWRSNIDFNVTKTTKLSVNIAGKVGYQNQPAGSTSNNTTELFGPILQAPTNTFPIKYSDGEWGDDKSLGYNVIANTATRGQRLRKSFQGWYDVYLTQNLDFIVKGLSAKARVSYNSYTETQSNIRRGFVHDKNDFEAQSTVIRYYREYDYSNPILNPDGSITYPLVNEIRHPNVNESGGWPVGVGYDNFRQYGTKLYYEGSIDYKASFGNHNVSALALVYRRVNDSAGDNKTFAFPEYMEGWVGRATYNWKERYLAEVNMAYEGSEKFAPGMRFGFFPSASVGWRISEEPFVKKLTKDKLSNLKVRYSYGQVGSDAGAGRFNYIQLFESGRSINLGYTQNIAVSPLYWEKGTANPNATWETATVQNLGIEIGLWHKLNVNLDLFNEARKGMLMERQAVASWVGADLPSYNLGRTKKHGLELEIKWNDRVGKDFSYNVGFNFATSEARIVFKDDAEGLESHMKAAGKPINSSSRYIAIGNYETIDDIFNYAQTKIGSATQGKLVPGDLVYIDFNGDGVIDTKDNVIVNHLNYPLTTFSLNLGAQYKGIALSMLIYAPVNVYKNLPDVYLWDFPLSNVKAQPNTLDRWTPETANITGVKRPTVHIENFHNSAASTYTYRDYSYLRLKNMEVSYEFPKKILNKINVSRLQVYVNGNNLLTFSKIDKRVDPETDGMNSYPIVKTYTTGLRISF